MKLISSRWGALGSLLAGCLLACFFLISAGAAERPRYGGVLRVEMRERVNSMDPRSPFMSEADGYANERLLDLVFERLVRLDDTGKPAPGLATSWEHDASLTHWQFQIRPGVKFHDGTSLTPAVAAAAMKEDTPGNWQVSSSDRGIAIELPYPQPGLLVDLATRDLFIFHRAQDTVSGTGPFRIAEWQAQKRLVLIASEDYWAGRPFVDRLEINLGVAPQQQLVDLELGRAEVVEVLPNLTRRASQSAVRVQASAPVELYSLTVAPRGAKAYDAQFSKALSLAIDRTAIVNVLLQRQGEPAGSLLPQWLSGYAFLFPTAPNLEQAKKIRAPFSSSPLLALDYDGSDPMAATLAQRIAVDARQAGIVMSVSAAPATDGPNRADVHLLGRHFTAPDADKALQAFLGDVMTEQAAGDQAGEARTQGAMIALDTPERRYAAERDAIDGGRIIPIVFVPEIYALGPSVRDWMPPRWGGWRLEDVWLDTTPRAAAVGGGLGNP